MTALTRNPQNTNLLQPTKYLLTFTRIPSAQYFLQSVNIPGISGSQTVITTPLLDYPVPGTKLDFSPFNINFLLDEQMESWRNIFSWFRSIAAPESFEERNRLRILQTGEQNKPSYYSDAILTILSNLNNPGIKIQFYNVFPVSLSDIQFDTRMSADDIMTADATFAYEYFNFI
jgi:hypothetical protein